MLRTFGTSFFTALGKSASMELSIQARNHARYCLEHLALLLSFRKRLQKIARIRMQWLGEELTC